MKKIKIGPQTRKILLSMFPTLVLLIYFSLNFYDFPLSISYRPALIFGAAAWATGYAGLLAGIISTIYCMTYEYAYYFVWNVPLTGTKFDLLVPVAIGISSTVIIIWNMRREFQAVWANLMATRKQLEETQIQLHVANSIYDRDLADIKQFVDGFNTTTQQETENNQRAEIQSR